MASVIAVDFGNENCVIAIPRHGSVDIVINQASQRLTPSMVAFGETRRYAGEFARQQQMQNVKSTITHLKRLIGLRYDTAERELVQTLVPFHLEKLEDGFIGVKVNYRNEEKIFRVEQCVALLLHEVFAIAKSHNAYTNDCVIVVSPWWDECQRRMILDAAEINGYHVLKLLNSTTAAAITYSMYHRKRLPTEESKSVPVAILDFGDSSLNVAVVQLYQGSIEVKGFNCDEHLGGAYFTSALVKLLIERTKKQYRIDPSTNPRAMLRFTQAAEKLKKGLSSNPIMPFEIQSLMNDVDVRFMIKREEFEEVITDLVEKIQAPVEEALKLANVKKEDLFAIEVHGGASRVASVKAKIKEIFGRDPTQSLNPDECFAQGAGFQAAIMSPQYKVPLTIKDVAPHHVMIEWLDETGTKKTQELFKQFNVCPCTKLVPIKVKKTCNIRLFNDMGDIGNVQINTGSDEVTLVKLRIRLTPDGLIDVQEAFYIVQEEIEVPDEPKPAPKTEEKKAEEKPAEAPKEGEAKPAEEAPKAEEKPAEAPKAEEKPAEAPKEGEAKPAEETPKAEEKPAEEAKPEEKPPMKKKIIKKEIKVKFEYETVYGLKPADILRYQREEKEMEKVDEDEIKIDNVKNELESYLFQMEKGIQYDYPEYFDPARKDEYLQKTNEIHTWFCEFEFDRLAHDEYKAKLDELRLFGEPALNRRRSFNTFPSTIGNLKQRIEDLKKRLEQKDEKFAHITDEDRNPVRKDIEDFIAWLDEKAKEVEKAPKHLKFPFVASEAENKFNALETKVTTCLGKPKPAPPKPEPKKEDEKKEGEKKEGDAAEKKEGDAAAPASDKPADSPETEQPKAEKPAQSSPEEPSLD